MLTVIGHRLDPDEPPKRVVYTANFDKYDHILPVDPNWKCDFICFTDDKENFPKGWRIETIDLKGESPTIVNRRIKILTHHYLSEYDESLYIDGNISIDANPIPLFEKYSKLGLLAIPKHPYRNCAYVEADICMKNHLVDMEVARAQMSTYSRLGFPRNFSLTENNAIYRKHNDSEIVNLMEMWWMEFSKYCKRDQLSLPYLLWLNRIKVIELEEGPRVSKKYFRYHLHKHYSECAYHRKIARIIMVRRHENMFYRIAAFIITTLIGLRDDIKRRFIDRNIAKEE
jgi:hypothetical protein